MPNTPPGLEIFSDEWFQKYATKVPKSILPAVKEICTQFQLGDTWMPNEIGEIIRKNVLVMIDEVWEKYTREESKSA